MPSPITLAAKDPDEVRRYRIDWNVGPQGQPGVLSSLGSDSISGVPTWILPAGITLVDQANDTTTTTARLSGGAAGSDYTLTCRIGTTAGETLEQSIVVPVRSKAA